MGWLIKNNHPFFGLGQQESAFGSRFYKTLLNFDQTRSGRPRNRVPRTLGSQCKHRKICCHRGHGEHGVEVVVENASVFSVPSPAMELNGARGFQRIYRLKRLCSSFRFSAKFACKCGPAGIESRGWRGMCEWFLAGVIRSPLYVPDSDGGAS